VHTPSKFQCLFFTELEKTVLNFAWNYKRPWVAKATLSKQKKPGGIPPPDFKIYYKVIVIKTTQDWHKKEVFRNNTMKL
jgi:hypothetical protein